MIRTQIQLTQAQVRWLKRKAAQQKKSVADLIRTSLDEMMRETIQPEEQDLRARALASAGALSGPADTSSNHDEYFTGAVTQ